MKKLFLSLSLIFAIVLSSSMININANVEESGVKPAVSVENNAPTVEELQAIIDENNLNYDVRQVNADGTIVNEFKVKYKAADFFILDLNATERKYEYMSNVFGSDVVGTINSDFTYLAFGMANDYARFTIIYNSEIAKWEVTVVDVNYYALLESEMPKIELTQQQLADIYKNTDKSVSVITENTNIMYDLNTLNINTNDIVYFYKYIYDTDTSKVILVISMSDHIILDAINKLNGTDYRTEIPAFGEGIYSIFASYDISNGQYTFRNDQDYLISAYNESSVDALNVTAAQNLLNYVDTLNSADYTVKSFEALTSPYIIVRDLVKYNGPSARALNPSQLTLDLMVAELQAAIDGLVKINQPVGKIVETGNGTPRLAIAILSLASIAGLVYVKSRFTEV